MNTEKSIKLGFRALEIPKEILYLIPAVSSLIFVKIYIPLVSLSYFYQAGFGNNEPWRPQD